MLYSLAEPGADSRLRNKANRSLADIQDKGSLGSPGLDLLLHRLSVSEADDVRSVEN